MGQFSPGDLVEGTGPAQSWADIYLEDCYGLLDEATEGLRRQLEHCDHLNCTLMTHSLSGGFGGAFTAKFLPEVARCVGKRPVWNLCLVPPPGVGAEHSVPCTNT